jgi:ABC-type transport system involved in cytochrome bd biosynthesis fused ATPase/permease subunit
MNKRYQFVFVIFIIAGLLSFFDLIEAIHIGIFMVGLGLGMIAETYFESREKEKKK